MMGGHMIVITLTLLIFIFAAFGDMAAKGSVVVSLLFSIFMLALDVLVSLYPGIRIHPSRHPVYLYEPGGLPS